MAEKRKVTLAYPRTINGQNHRAGTSVSVENHEALELLRLGLARDADAEPSTSVAVNTTAKDGK